MSDKCFLGKWKLVSNENLFEFLNIRAKSAHSDKVKVNNDLIMSWAEKEPGQFGQTFTTASGFSTTTLFKLGDKSFGAGAYGGHKWETFTLNGNVLREEQVFEEDSKKFVTERTFTGDKMNAIFSIDDVVFGNAQFERV